MGAVMMTGFFMLSGFCLYIVYEHKSLMNINDMKRFYIKRLIGILPSYYCVGLFYTVLLSSESIIQDIVLLPVQLLGLQSVFSTLFSFSHNGGTWFISCIILCYFFFPFILEVIMQTSMKLKITLLVICCSVLLYAPFVAWVFGLNNIYSNPFFRTLEFIVGILFASMTAELQRIKFVTWYLFTYPAVICEIIVCVVAISLGIRLQISPSNYMLYSWIVLPIFCMMIPTLSSLSFKTINNSKVVSSVISFMSKISYAFFLAQLFIWPLMRFLCEKFSIGSNALKIILSFGVCIVLAIIIYELIEKPFRTILSNEFLKG